MKKIILPALMALSLSGCFGSGSPRPDLGVAPPPQMPNLPPVLNKKAERLPDITDRSLGGIHRDGTETDVRYNELSFRYNAIVDAWSCVREALNTRSADNLNRCFAGNGPSATSPTTATPAPTESPQP